jgi:predicted nucleotidyltransferase
VIVVSAAPAWYRALAALMRETKSADAPLVSRLVRGLERVSPPVVSAYLFGSHAEGRAHRESDVDLGILLSRATHPTRRERFEARVLLSSRLAAELRQNAIDVVILNDAPPQFARRIVTRGRRVFCSNAAADHAFVRDVQLRAADLEPFLRRTRRVKLAAIAR